MRNRLIFAALAVLAAIAFLIVRDSLDGTFQAMPPPSTKSDQPTPTSLKSQTPVMSGTDAPSRLETQQEDPKLTAAKKEFPWIPEEKLKLLIEGQINIKNIERGRSAISNDLSLLKISLEDYKRAVGSYPNGENLEFSKALSGNNPTKTAFLEWPQGRLGDSGELLDPWGTPYQMSVTAEGKLDIRSAGKDRVFSSADDEVLKP